MKVNDIYIDVFPFPAKIRQALGLTPEYPDVQVIDFLGGRGRGGSHAMAQHALYSLMYEPFFHGFFMRAIHGTIRGSLWKGFCMRFQEEAEAGNLNPNNFILSDNKMSGTYIPTGNTITSKGFKTSSGGQTASLKSLEGATTVYIEEAEETTEEQHLKLVDSLRKGKMQIFRSWNIPTKQHYLIQNWFDTEPVNLQDADGNILEGWFRLKAKGVPGHRAIFGTYLNNYKNIPKTKALEWEKYFYTNPEHYFSDIKGYASGGAKGVIFKFNKHWFKYSKLPDTDFFEVAGLDFGGGGGDETDEVNGHSKVVLMTAKIHKATMSVYLKLHLYTHFIEPTDLAVIIKSKIPGNIPILADNARTDSIRQLLNRGLYVVGAKTKEGKSSGVVSGYNIVKKYKLFIHEEDEQIEIELNNHKWAENKTTGKLTDNPEDLYKDIPDTIRYMIVYYDLNYNFGG